MNRTALLVDSRDRRIGKTQVPAHCSAIEFREALFIRTGEAVKLRPAHRALADVFRETEPFVKRDLEEV